MNKLFGVFLFVLCFNSIFAQTQIGGDSLIIDYGNPRQYEVGGILISGTRYLDETVLINISGITVGDSIEIPGEKISKAIENLWKQGLFSDIKIVSTRTLGNKIFLEIQLLERPRLSTFRFTGVSKSEAEKIREKINIGDKVVTENLLETTKNTVRDFYIDKGYLNAEIKIESEKDTLFANREKLTIHVDRKEKVKVANIIFEGNTFFSNSKLKRSMKETKEKRWYKIFTGAKFIDDNYQEDKISLITAYADQGYRDAKIVRDSVYQIKPDRVNIHITVDEGHQYFFRNITWLGNTKHTSTELSTILGIKKGDIYNQSVLDQRLYMNQNGRDVSSLYLDDGYLFFNITPVEINVEGDSIDFEMRIVEGKQARINRVTVSGNVKTNDRVIMREIRSKPGQLFSRNDIIRTQRELLQLGYFDQEKLGINTVPNPAEGTVDIEYTVEERPSDQLELSGGYGANQLVGTLGLSFNNFSARNFFKKGAWRPLPSGDGQKLSVRFQTNGKYFQSYNASFTEPYLGGKKPNSFSVSLFHQVQSNGAASDSRSRQSIKISGITLGFGQRLKKPDDFFSVYYSASYTYYTLNNYVGTFLFNNGNSNNFALGATISRNSIDAPIYPRSGSQISLSLNFTPPYSLFKDIDYSTATYNEKYKFIEYHKWKFTSSWFSKLAGNLVLNTKIQFGFLGLYNRELGASPFERFYLGGDGLSGFSLDGREIIGLRGYENNSITPIDENGVTVGGTIFDKYTFELRYPITLNPSATIYFLTFAEAGNNWLNFKEFNPFKMYRSIGAGIRVFLPVFGLLGLDYGYGYDNVPYRPDVNGAQFHFSIGQQF